VATVLLRLGRPAEARAMCERAIALREVLVREQPSFPRYRKERGETFLRMGQVRAAQRDLAGASDDWRHAIALFQSVPNMESEYIFFHACCHAALLSMAGLPGTGVSAGDTDLEAERALALLRQAAGIGYRAPNTYRTETALDPLRGRDDFRLLMMDLAMPANPLARNR
jgi:eukaryotic-like serine/threonine-protein kinase